MNSSSKTTAGQDVLTVTPEFKKEAAKSIIAIVGFILVYLLLFALSIGIVLLSVYGGIAIIALRPFILYHPDWPGPGRFWYHGICFSY
jgi:hypothetical protein